MGASTFRDIKDLLSQSNGEVPSELIQKQLKELEEEWETLITPSEKDEAFKKYQKRVKYGTTGKIPNPLANKPKLSAPEIKAKAEALGEQLLGSNASLKLDDVGDGHPDREFGEAYNFTTGKKDLRLTIATHGGYPLRIISLNQDQQTVDIDELVRKIIAWAESTSKDHLKFERGIGRSGAENEVIEVFEVVDGVQDRAHAIRIQFHYDGPEEVLEEITFADFYKDRKIADVEPGVSVEEARKAISTELWIDGEPELALVKGKHKGETLLAYLFKVEGINASVVTVNAKTGEFVRVE